MAIAQVVAGARILISDINAYYNLLKGVGAGEAITLAYNAAGSLILQPSSDPAAATEAIQVKNNAGTVQSALSFDGRFYAADGLVGTPGLTFEQDKDTGFYRTAANTVGIALGGALVGQFGSGGFLIPDGLVGTPGSAFIADPDTGLYRIGTNILGLATAGTEALRITAAQLAQFAAGVQMDAVTVGRLRMSSYSLANNAVGAVFPGFNTFTGLVFVVDRDSARVGVVEIKGGNNSATLVYGSLFTTTAGGAGTNNVYWSAGNTRYEIENKIGSTRNYVVFVMVGD